MKIPFYMKYKDIDGFPTPYKGEHTPLYKRIINKLYKKHINRLFVPNESTIHITKHPTIRKKIGVEDIKFTYPNGSSFISCVVNKITSDFDGPL